MTAGSPPADASAAATNITQWATVTGSESLNLRSSGSYSGSIIGSIPGGTVLPVFSSDGEWARVQYGQQVGYCAVSYLTLSSVYPQDVNGSGSSAMVSLPGGVGAAPMRVSASTSASVLSYVSHGTQVIVHSNDGSWCLISVGGVTGYILSSALDFGSTGVVPTDPPLTGDEQYATVTPELSTLNLRSGPSTSYAVIAEIPKGTQIVVTSYGSVWCAVRWGELTGYVMTEYLTFDGEPTPAPSTTHVPAGSPALTLQNADMHEAAGNSSPVQLMIPSGETVTVLQWGDEWTQITYVGLTGYVHTDVLRLYQDMTTDAPVTSAPTASPTPSPTPTPTPTPVPTFTPVDGTAVVIMNAQLREEPDTGSRLLGTIAAGTNVQVAAVGTSWSRIIHDGVTGWVLTSQLHITVHQPTEEPTATPTVVPSSDELLQDESEDEQTGVIAWIVSTVSGISLRSSASTESTVLATIPAGTQIVVLEEDATWSRIRYNTQFGYVFSQYLTYAEPSEALGLRYVSTARDPLALRDAPSTEAKLLTRMERGSLVTLLSVEGDWCYVQFGQQKGYCAARYLSTEKPENRVMDDTRLLDYTLTEVSGWEATVNTSGSSVFMREWCSTDAPEVTELQNGARMTVLQKGDIWCHVAIEGNEGYCLTSQLNLISPAE